jgi:hypothetical protein
MTRYAHPGARLASRLVELAFEAARILGIDTQRAYATTFALNAAICGAGAAESPAELMRGMVEVQGPGELRLERKLFTRGGRLTSPVPCAGR